MNRTPAGPLAATPLGRRGIALPVALLGLVAVSLMVTTVLLTSSTESAVGAAHVDAARSLYTAEQGLNTYVSSIAQNGTALGAGVSVWTIPGSSESVQITTARLIEDTLADLSVRRVFSLTAEPRRTISGAVTPGGRSVVAMVLQNQPPPNTLNMNITSAITLGGNLDVNGNAFTVNGRFNGCGVSGGVSAVRMSDSSEVIANNNNHFNNFLGYENGQNVQGRAAIDSTTLTRQQLAYNVLGGLTVDQIVAMIPDAKKWGPRFNRTTPVWDGRVDTLPPPPEDVAVVDANGGEVEVLGGKGMLIIVNGNMRMRGNSRFDGVIILEGNFSLSGTPTVAGALISLALTGENVIDDESAIGSGHITVQFDKCDINQAIQAFGRASVPQTPRTSTTFSWFEMVR